MPGHTKKVDIDEMIANLPRNEQVLVKMLRALIIECIPQATEKASLCLGLVVGLKAGPQAKELPEPSLVP